MQLNATHYSDAELQIKVCNQRLIFLFIVGTQKIHPNESELMCSDIQ